MTPVGSTVRAVADPADDLFALPLADFTAARDALAKELRAAGDRPGADAVKRLRRPTVAMWATNLAARERPDDLEELLGAWDALRQAQEHLVAGSGDRAELRAASERQRAAVAAFMKAARDRAQEHGERLTGAALDKVRETLQVAATDDTVRAALQAGRLEREASGTTAGLFGLGDPASESGGRPASANPPDASPVTEARQPSTEERRASAEERRRLAAEREAAETALREAGRAEKQAHGAAEKASRRVERAEGAVDRAQAALEGANEDLAEAREDQAAARAALRAAKEASAAAQAGLDAL